METKLLEIWIRLNLVLRPLGAHDIPSAHDLKKSSFWFGLMMPAVPAVGLEIHDFPDDVLYEIEEGTLPPIESVRYSAKLQQFTASLTLRTRLNHQYENWKDHCKATYCKKPPKTPVVKDPYTLPFNGDENQ